MNFKYIVYSPLFGFLTTAENVFPLFAPANIPTAFNQAHRYATEADAEKVVGLLKMNPMLVLAHLYFVLPVMV